jgi:negative regulator of replication initiation
MALTSKFRASKDTKLKAVNVIIDTVSSAKDLVQNEPVKAALSALVGFLTLLKVLSHRNTFLKTLL